VSPEHPDQEENAYRYQYPSPSWERAHESTRGGLSASANQDSGENWAHLLALSFIGERGDESKIYNDNNEL